MKKLQTNQSGFTIIEVLIVLAIAGLIMLIVFLAVPALQRNSRNTQRRNDAAGLLGAVNEWATNNNGNMPTATADQTAALANANLGIYKGVVTWGTSWPTGTDAAVIAVNQKCATQSTLTAQTRAVAVLFRVEASGSSTGTQQCVDS